MIVRITGGGKAVLQIQFQADVELSTGFGSKIMLRSRARDFFLTIKLEIYTGTHII
jgi:hypothetical protein